MGVAAPRAPFGGSGPGPHQEFGPSLLVNCYLDIKFHKIILHHYFYLENQSFHKETCLEIIPVLISRF